VSDTTTLRRLLPGENAPDFEVQRADGGVARLGDYSGRRLLLVFVRHLACLPCQQHLHEIDSELAVIEGSGARILVISFDGHEEVRHYRLKLNVSFPVASDESRAAYRAYGLARASFLRTWHPKTLSRYVTLLRQGLKLQKPRKGSDLSQLGADFVVDADGRVAFAHYSERPDDRPAIADVVRAVIGFD